MELLLNNDDNTIQDKLIELIEMNESIRILSPYLTKNNALNCILQKSAFKLKIVLNFDPKSILNHIPSIDINLVKELIESGHEVFNNRKLHSKLYITDENLILGSSNFTDSGLRTKKESAIHLKRDSNPKIYEECKKYFDSIIKDSKKVTRFQINKINRVLNNYNDLDNTDLNFDVLERLEEVFSDNNTKNSYIDDYELKNRYPKKLQELQNGLSFNLVDYAEMENEYRTKFQGSARNKDEKISFIKSNLYDKNKGYNIITKINGGLSTIYKWHRDNKSEFAYDLKPHSEFKIDRTIEILTLYKESFDIQPVTGDFANLFKTLKDKEIKNDDFFSVNLSVFKEDRDFRILKERLEEIDDFITRKGHLPNQFARTNIKTIKTKGSLSKYEEGELKNEGRLFDYLYHIKKRYNNKFYNKELMKYIEDYCNKWGWFL